MYSSRGSNAYGQQPYAGQSGYGQKMGPAGGSAGGPDGTSQLSLASQHSSIRGALQEADVGGYRARPSAAAHYGGQYSSLYGSAGLSASQQHPAFSNKGAGQSVLEGRGSYISSVPASPKFASSEYVSSSSHGYGRKNEALFAEKFPDYPSLERRQYERQGAYIGRDVQTEPTGRFTDSIGYGHQRQPEMYDRMDQTSLLRQEHLLKAQSRHSTALDGSSRKNEYLAASVPANRHPDQDLVSYGGRMDADPQSLSMLGASSYGGPKAPSILGAAPRRNADDLIYGQSSLNPGYGVSLPPGRDYTTGKGLHSSESDYSSSILSSVSHPRIEERKDDRASYLQEFELREEERRREWLREREREREREKERQREREREREWERERDRERERERARERERLLEKRDKEKERERKRLSETGRERTPLRPSKDRRGSSLTKEGRSLRRDSPHHEASNRRPSPVKQIRREYVCKVSSSSLVAVERDYVSLDKCYPRLLVPPEFSKVVMSWPKDCLKLSFYTPVSFEHDFLEDESAAEPKDLSTKLPFKDSEQPVRRDIVWNAKVILMSGLSRSALENLSSDKSFGDHVPHICSILRFAVLRKDHSFMAIGGPWNFSDGSDPSVDDSSLVQTVLRYAKDMTQLDLQSCKHWNRFLEIHYDRIGKDGLFSHKEITVLFVPDLSDCLPSLEAWRQQWLAHKNAIAEREQRRHLKDERSGDRMDGTQDMGSSSLKDSKTVGKSEKSNDSETSRDNGNGDQKDNDAVIVQGGETEERSGNNEKKDADEMAEVDKDAKANESGETSGAQAAGTVKTGKKKVIRKIVKQKVADKKAIMEKSDGKQSDNLDKDAGDGNVKSETASEQNEASTGVKTFVRKKVVKKVSVVKEGMQSEVKAEMETDCTGGETQEKTDPDSTMVGQDSGAKTTIKRKIIRKVPKKKVVDGETNVGVADSREDGGEQIAVKEEKMGYPIADTKSQAGEVNKSTKKVISKKKSQVSATQKQNMLKTSAVAESVVNKDEKGVEEKIGSSTTSEGKPEKEKAAEKDVHEDKSLREGESKNDQEKNDAIQKDEFMRKSDEDTRAKRKTEEPPRPGLILQTKGPKGSKSRSLSLSLDSLLDYSDKDAEESNFELSVFAESLYEMLQYQMGCRLFDFLQKLRAKFIIKRNERKRRREETQETGNYKKAPKQSKAFELPPKSKSATPETADVSAKPEDEKTKDKDDSNDNLDNERMNEGADNNEDLEEDPEEDPEKYDEMEETASQLEISKEATEQLEKNDINTGPEKVGGNKESGAEELAKDKESAKDKSSASTPASKPDHDTSAPGKGEDVGTGMRQAVVEDILVNKELLQAFRFFDRNRVGYIRVEDMRLIIHSLGKFLSHRDVKEMVACALWESNTGRDDRILYEKLVRLSDV